MAYGGANVHKIRPPLQGVSGASDNYSLPFCTANSSTSRPEPFHHMVNNAKRDSTLASKHEEGYTQMTEALLHLNAD